MEDKLLIILHWAKSTTIGNYFPILTGRRNGEGPLHYQAFTKRWWYRDLQGSWMPVPRIRERK